MRGFSHHCTARIFVFSSAQSSSEYFIYDVSRSSIFHRMLYIVLLFAEFATATDGEAATSAHAERVELAVRLANETNDTASPKVGAKAINCMIQHCSNEALFCRAKRREAT